MKRYCYEDPVTHDVYLNFKELSKHYKLSFATIHSHLKKKKLILNKVPLTKLRDRAVMWVKENT